MHERRTSDEGRFRWECELIYDKVRQKVVSDAASRLNCVFVCPKVAHARNFVREIEGRTDVVYEVEPLEDLDEVCLSDWGLFDFGNFSKPYPVAQWADDAQKYWTTAPTRKCELLVPCPVRVLKAR